MNEVDRPADEAPERAAAGETWVEDAPAASAQLAVDKVATRVQTMIEAAERAAEAIRLDAQRQAESYLAEAQRRADRLTSERVQMIARLTDNLIEHATAVRQHSEAMVASLEGTIESVSADIEEHLGPIDDVELDAAPQAFPTAAGGEEGTGGQGGYAAEPYWGGVHPLGAEPAHYPEPEPVPPSFIISRAEEPVSARSHDYAEAEPEIGEGNGAPDAREPGEPEVDWEAGQPDRETEALAAATQLAIAGNDRATIADELRSRFSLDDPEPILDRIFGE